MYIALGVNPDELQSFEAVCDTVHNIKSHNSVSKKEMMLIADLPHRDDKFYRHLANSLHCFRKNPFLSMLDVDAMELDAVYATLKERPSPQV